MDKNKGSIILLVTIFVGVAILAIAGGAGYKYFWKTRTEDKTIQKSVGETEKPAELSIITAKEKAIAIKEEGGRFCFLIETYLFLGGNKVNKFFCYFNKNALQEYLNRLDDIAVIPFIDITQGDYFMESFLGNIRRFDRLEDFVAYEDKLGNLGYVILEEEKYFAIINGKIFGPYDYARAKYAESVFSPDGRNFAYVAKDQDGWFVVFNGRESGKRYNFIGNSLPPIYDVYDIYWSNDSKKITYISVKQQGQDQYKYLVVIEGENDLLYESKLYDKIDILEGIEFSQDNKYINYKALEDNENEYKKITNRINW
jgi:hypothetical protein